MVREVVGQKGDFILLTVNGQEYANILNAEQTVIVRDDFPENYRGWIYLYGKLKENEWLVIDNIDLTVLGSHPVSGGELFNYRETVHYAVVENLYKQPRYKEEDMIFTRVWCDKVEKLGAPKGYYAIHIKDAEWLQNGEMLASEAPENWCFATDILPKFMLI